MGFFEKWFTEKVNSVLGPPPPLLQPAAAGGARAPFPSPRSGLPAAERLRPQAAHHPRDFTTKPTIDPAVLETILPRDGELPLTVSGLDGVLTVGKDMLMTTDQPIHCKALRVLGTLEATVYAQKLIVADGATVVGSVRVDEAEVRGQFEGSLQARGKVSIHSTAHVVGKVRARELAISKEANVTDADIKRVVPRADDLAQDYVGGMRFDDGNSSMCITVSQKSALRR